MLGIHHIRMPLYGIARFDTVTAIRWEITPELIGGIVFKYIMSKLNAGTIPTREVFLYKIISGAYPEIIAHLNVMRVKNMIFDYNIGEVAFLCANYFQDVYLTLIRTLPEVLTHPKSKRIILIESGALYIGVKLYES